MADTIYRVIVVDESKGTQYTLLNNIGTAPAATVYRAKVISAANHAREEDVAILIIDTHHPESEKLIDAMLKNKKQSTHNRPANKTLVPVLDSTFTTNYIMHMIMPYFPEGSLLSIMINNPQFSNGIDEQFIGLVLKHVTNGISLLHRNHEFHGDIGCSRIFVKTSGTCSIKLAYAASVFEEDDMPPTHFPWRTPPEPGNWIPELMALKPPDYTEKMDTWYIGITALELAFGGAHRIPVSNHQDLFRMVRNLVETSQLPPPKIYTAKKTKIPKFLQFLKGKQTKASTATSSEQASTSASSEQASTSASSEQRKTMGPLFRSMIEYCLKPDPLSRPTCQALPFHPFFFNNTLDESDLGRLIHQP